MLDRDDLVRWFERKLGGLRLRKDTQAYVTGVFSNYRTEDLIHLSVVLAYEHARETNQFDDYRRVGDWVLWCGTFVPVQMDAHRQVFESLGRLSYGACYRILHSQWPLYEELADELPSIVNGAREVF